MKNNCVVCQKNDFSFFTEKNNFKLYRCKNCGLIVVQPLPDPSFIYNAQYFSGAEHGFGYVDYDRDKAAANDFLNTCLDNIESFLPAKGKLFDVGTATGYFLELAQNRGWDVSGLEIADYAAEMARNKKLDVKTGTLETVSMEKGQFDAITIWDVIEHMTDPVRNINMAKELLKSGGLLAINTPDAGSLIAKLLGKKWHLIVPPEHLFYFNRINLSTLLENAGFRVLYKGGLRKKFKLQYALQTMAHSHNSSMFKILAGMTRNNFLSDISIPSLKDNLFIIARKI